MYTGRTTTREELIESMFADGAGGGGGGGGFQAGVMNELLSGKTFINFSPDNIKAKQGQIMTTSWQENVTIDKDGTANVIAKRIATFYIDINRLQANGGEGWLESAWNSPLARYLVPDKFTIALGAEITGILGIGIQPINFSILTRGKEPGIYYTPTVNANLGAGAFFSAGVEFTSSYFTGDPRNITASMLSGHTYGIMANGGYLADLSLSGSYSPTNSRGTQGFINGSVGIGVGVGAFGGAQYQYTIGSIPIWQWNR